MTDPTIPELVARLRELHNARRYPTETLVATIRDDQSAQVYATSTGPMRVVRPVAETTVDHADLIAETLNALPTLLDALERQTSGDSGGVEQGDNPGVSYLRTVANNLRLRGGTITFTAPQLETVRAGLGAHSPDGGKVLDCDHCGTPCIPTCVACGETYSTTAKAAACEDAGFRSPRAPGAWRPISEPPSAEVHAWCGGWFLFERESPTPGPEPTHAVLRVDATRWPKRVSSDWARYLPIPPSDERRG